MRAELHISGTWYRVEVDVLAGSDPENDNLSSYTIWEGQHSRHPWDGPSRPEYFTNDLAALRAGIDYLLDGIESEQENE